MCQHCDCSTAAWLHVADILWSYLVVGPTTVFYWVGTWKLMDDYVYEHDSRTSAYISLAIGMTVGFIAYMALPLIEECVEVRCHWKHVTLSRILINVQNFSTLNYWRGVWGLMDSYVGSGIVPSVIALSSSTLLLLLLRAASNAVATPYTITLDTRPQVYRATPLFRTPPDSVILYTLDCAISHFVIVPLVVQVWRGLWYVLDDCILPDNLLRSYLLSLGTGYVAACILFALERPVLWAAKKLYARHWFLELCLEDMFKLTTIFASLLLWHGGWGLLKDYALTTSPLAWAAHVTGTSLLLLLQVASTVGTATVTKDCEFGQGTGIPYRVAYFSTFHQQYTAHRRRMMLNEDVPHVEREGLMASSDDSSDEEFYRIN